MAEYNLRINPTLGGVVKTWCGLVGTHVVVRLLEWVVTCARSAVGLHDVVNKKHDGDEDDNVCGMLMGNRHGKVNSKVMPATIVVDGYEVELAQSLPASRARSTILRSFWSQTRLREAVDWKKASVRSAYLTMAWLVAVVCLGRCMLFVRTGSWYVRPYDWYSMPIVGERLHSTSVELPTHILASCKFRNVSIAKTELLSVADVIANASDIKRKASPKVVYVVPFTAGSIVTMSDDNLMPQQAALMPSTHNPLEVLTVPYQHVEPREALSVFPFWWNVILGEHFAEQVKPSSLLDRTVETLNLTFHLVQSVEELDALPSNSSLLVIAQGLNDMTEFLAMNRPKIFKVGFIALAREDCNNPEALQLLGEPRIRFGLMPFGDCTLVDGKRFSTIPLGPSFKQNFPINAHATYIPAISERQYLLNLVVSWSVLKPTRIQAMMAALDVCDTVTRPRTFVKRALAPPRKCVIEHNDFVVKALQHVDDRIGTHAKGWLSAPPSAHVDNLKQSVFTLCPYGNNPEESRVWEAMAVGSIPIVEDWVDEALEPGKFYHPSYPTTWKCVREDIHGILKRLKAPVLFVRDWERDLSRLIDYYVRHPQELTDLQTRVTDWYAQVGRHLQATLIQNVLDRFD
ncbi:TPA: hypothetical protein N0F65_001942 [Lagenidium giganteum]|uniref:RXYLT1 C-terminal domain-containing protein n=1 Tax=Lagenidium giganteum TaxID=4803 RepID=A0AAV2YY18_9STRA|nr:TPA: hypothetical protein N0F65_001942 [Lagenidium giganteum]